MDVAEFYYKKWRCSSVFSSHHLSHCVSWSKYFEALIKEWQNTKYWITSSIRYNFLCILVLNLKIMTIMTMINFICNIEHTTTIINSIIIQLCSNSSRMVLLILLILFYFFIFPFLLHPFYKTSYSFHLIFLTLDYVLHSSALHISFSLL